MKIGVYIGNAHPESGGAFTYQNDVLDSLRQNKGQHEYYIFTGYSSAFQNERDFRVVSINLRGYRKIYYKIVLLIKHFLGVLLRKKVRHATHLTRLMKKHEIDIAWFMSSTFEDPGVPY